MTSFRQRDDQSSPIVPSATLNGESVLLVDDDRVGLLVIERALCQAGYAVDTASDGAEAQRLLETRNYPSIITDLYMPEIDGMELLQHARTTDPNAQVILLTDLASAKTAADALRFGAFDYITKPIQDLNQLINVVGNAIALKRALDDRDNRSSYLDALTSTANVAMMARTPGELLKLLRPVISSTTKSDVVAQLLRNPRLEGTEATDDATPAGPIFHFYAAPGAEASVVAGTIDKIQEAAHKFFPRETAEQVLSRLTKFPTSATGTDSEEALMVPVISHDRTDPLGVIAVGARSHSPFSAGEIQTLRGIADHLALVVGRLNLERNLARRDQMALGVEAENKRLQDLSHLKDHLLTTASHELRTPINAIVGFATLLQDELDGPLTQAQRHDVERILRNAHDLIGVVDEILDLERIEQGSLRVEATNCDLVSLVTECLETAEAMPRNDATAIIGPIVPEGLGFELFTDAAKVRRILLNLLSNAVHFTQSGEIRAELSQPSPGTVDIHVSDTGPGIPAGQRDLIFERFWQARRLETESTRPSTTAKAKKGVGIGLNLSRDLATLLGGSLELVDLEDPGARFRLRLTTWR